MKVQFERSFLKDIDKLNDKKLKEQIAQTIIEIEGVTGVEKISNVIKMKGNKTAYRKRIGDYRLGFFYENDTIILSRFMQRKDIYNYFP